MSEQRIGLAGRGALQLARVRMMRYLPDSIAGVVTPSRVSAPDRELDSMPEDELIRLLADMVYKMLLEEARLQRERRGMTHIGR